MDTWSVKDGLPLRDINSIAQTPDGFIWMGTDAGLIRFDGNTFTFFNSSNMPEIEHNGAYGLFVDNHGQLWIGTGWNGFGILRDGHYHQVIPSTEAWTAINAIYQAKDGSIWACGNHDSRIFRYKDGHTDAIPSVNETIDTLTEAGDGSILLGGANSGLYAMDKHRKTARYKPDTIKINIGISKLLYGSHNDLWIATWDKGLYHYINGKVHFYGLPEGLSSLCIRVLYKDRHGIIWVGTNNGIDRWDGSRFIHFDKSDGLPGNNVNAIYEDMEGNLWVSSDGRLCKFTEPKIIPVAVVNHAQKANINRISYAGNEQIWCATDIGVCLVGQYSTTWFGNSFSSKSYDIIETPDHYVWIFRSKPDNLNKLEIVCISRSELMKQALPEKQDGAPPLPLTPTVAADKSHYRIFPLKTNISITVLKPDGKGIVAFGPDGLFFFYKTGKMVHRKYGLGWVFNGYKDAKGDYWVCSTDGLIRISLKGIRKCNDGLPNGLHILGIANYNDKIKWCCSDKGLLLYDGNRLHSYTSKNGIPGPDSTEVIIDNNGDLWAAGSYGYIHISNNKLSLLSNGLAPVLHPQLYQESDGVKGFAGGLCAVKSESGSLWFATDNGITLIKPDKIIRNTILPPVTILSAYVDKTALKGSGMTVVPPGTGMLRANYTAATYVANEKTLYRYRLLGWSDKWVDAGKMRSLNYMNLPYGEYKLQIIACNNDGIWNTQGPVLTFKILPHYYQTLWFKILEVVMIVGAVAVFFMIRIHRIKQRNIELEEKVNIRTAELAESNKSLQVAKIEIEAQYDELQAAQSELEAQNEEIIAMHESLVTANAQLENLASLDGLTGMKNHRIFQEELNREWSRMHRNGSPLSVILLDIDHFKQLNDSYGHLAGDEVLIQLGVVLNCNIREHDLAARYGGEEFVIIAPDTAPDDATQLAERLRQSILSTKWTNRQVTASFGVATFFESANKKPSDLVAFADKALYISKSSGRNKVTHYDTIAVEKVA